MPGHDMYQGRLSIPYQTPSGVVAMRFRDLSELSPAKYLGVSGAATRLYNTRALFTDETHIAICEGELDTIVMQERVGIPAVGIAGGNGWKEHMPRCFADFEKVFVVCDNDQKEDGSNPGQQFSKKIAASLNGIASIVRPPSGMDVTDWFCAEGADAIRKKVLG